ncbi:hypothetical protein H5410_007544 [Solanum commersonii]|uniref:DC-UbP/UBTD2 N-terminal domain-containing protein n=1 Tax=Solanum commersonii TaxID=4109 RepID=A0A9J6ACA5_SOLCO|nr:hypothetical protein H5410_007544 [Solanum commersonii]
MAKRELSGTLRNLKFMQRASLREEKPKKEEEKLQNHVPKVRLLLLVLRRRVNGLLAKRENGTSQYGLENSDLDDPNEDLKSMETVRKIRKPKPWRHSEPITRAQLLKMREEFWDTAPHYGGKKASASFWIHWFNRDGCVISNQLVIGQLLNSRVHVMMSDNLYGSLGREVGTAQVWIKRIVLDDKLLYFRRAENDFEFMKIKLSMISFNIQATSNFNLAKLLQEETCPSPDLFCLSILLEKIWDALRAAAEAEIGLAQTIVNSAGIIVQSADLTVCYDERGAKYDLPQYVLSEPTNLTGEN